MGMRSDIYQELNQVFDPEIPGISIFEMGILRNVIVNAKGIVVEITPTYCGCPALKAIENDVYITLEKAGYKNIAVKTTYSPAWTTDWLSSKTKKKLRHLGIASPKKRHQQSIKTLSQFGSTPCKALFYCKICLEPFDYLKCI